MLKAITLPKIVRDELGLEDEKIGEAYLVNNQKVYEQNKNEEDGELEMNETEAQERENKIVRQLLSEGKYQILPSFFRTMVYLKKMKKEFAIVLHNYNKEDLNNAVIEFNQFCKGEHPCYNGKNGTSMVKFDGSKGTKDFRFKDKHQKAVYYRKDEDNSNNLLVTGTTIRVRLLIIKMLYRPNKEIILKVFIKVDLEKEV